MLDLSDHADDTRHTDHAGSTPELYDISNTTGVHNEVVFLISDEENDEDQNGLYYLPAAPEVDDPEEAFNPDVRNVSKNKLTCIIIPISLIVICPP